MFFYGFRGKNSPFLCFHGKKQPNKRTYWRWDSEKEMYNWNGLKAQKLLAQGIALGIIAITKTPCKGKSFVYWLVLQSFCPYRATGLRLLSPRAMPWARSFCPFRAYCVISTIGIEKISTPKSEKRHSSRGRMPYSYFYTLYYIQYKYYSATWTVARRL